MGTIRYNSLNLLQRPRNPPERSAGCQCRALGIGMARGDKRSQMLCLQVDGGLALATGTSTVPLAELVRFHDGEYSVDSAMIRQLVDSATTADPRYTPSNARREAGKLDTQAKYEGWRKEYRKLKKKSPNKSDVWYSLQIAKLPIAMAEFLRPSESA